MHPLASLAAQVGLPPVVWLGLMVLCLIVIGIGKLFSAATKTPPPPQQPGQYPPGQYPPPYPPAQQSQPFTPPQVPSCTTCGGPGRWLAESNAWGCDRCRQLIGPPPSAPR